MTVKTIYISRRLKTFFYFLFFISIPAISQKQDKQNLSFDYIKLPSEPIDKNIKNYSSSVVLVYEADVIAKKKKAQDEFEIKKVEYVQKVAAAGKEYDIKLANYKADLDAWNKKSMASRIIEKNVLQGSKPVEPVLYKPPEPQLQEPQLQKIFDRNMLASVYLKIEGFNNSPDNAVKITATLYGFEIIEPELRSIEEHVFNPPPGSKTTITTNWYVIKYKHPIGLKIELPDGKILMDEIPEKLAQYSEFSTTSAKDSYPVYDKVALIDQLQNKVVEENMKFINEIINSKYGSIKTKRTTSIYRIEPKKFTYDDFQQAYESAVSGYGILIIDYKRGIDKLNAAIDLWEKSLTEYNPKEKKSRIDEDVAKAARFNLAEAYIWTNNFEKADAQLSRIIGLNPSNKEKRAIEELRILFNDQQSRWNANNK